MVSVAANDQLLLVLLSFVSESNRLHIQRMRIELGLRLRHPTVRKSVAVQADAGASERSNQASAVTKRCRPDGPAPAGRL